MSFVCESPWHDEDAERLVANRYDQYIVTVVFMRSDNQRRLGRVGPAVPHRRPAPGGLRVCRDCAERWMERLRAGAAVLGWGEGYVPEPGKQQTLL